MKSVDPSSLALVALRLLAVDPGLNGMRLRARSGPTRDRLLSILPDLPLPLPTVRLHPGMTEEQLSGGVDITRSLSAGRLCQSRGLLSAETATYLLPMAERTPRALAARLAAVLDAREESVLIALDEGIDDEALPDCFSERLAFQVMLDDGGGLTDFSPFAIGGDPRSLSTVEVPDETLKSVVGLARQLGILSMRPVLQAVRAARASAALAGRARVEEEDLILATQLVLAPRAMHLPEPEHGPDASTADPAPEEQPEIAKGESVPEDVLLEAISAVLPEEVLARLRQSRPGQGLASGSGSGERMRGNRRGRPLPSRPCRGGQGARIDLVATLRAAAPWQMLRRGQGAVTRHLVQVRPADIRYARHEDRSDRLLVFAVDASGSAAASRLAEAKGAVEYLLAEAYARRDHVALIAYRGDRAEALLPPTRSLVQARRNLAALPGGGTTPLASGLEAALRTALAGRGRGMTPAIVLLAEGRANMPRVGVPDRENAFRDALGVADAIRAKSVETLVVDVSRRPQSQLQDLAVRLSAVYAPLPVSDARRLSRLVADELG